MKNLARRGFGYHAAGTLVLLTATLAASMATSHRKSEPLLAPLSSIDLRIREFVGTENPPLPDNVLKELNPTSYITRTYKQPSGMEADLFIAFYAQQRAGESMHSPKHCLPGSGWEIWDYDAVEIPVRFASPPPAAVENRTFRINKYSISHESDRRLVLYWYQSKERIFASEYLGKLLLARDALLDNSTAAAIVRIVVRDKPGALKAASALASDLIPQMQRCFRPQ